MKRKPLIIANWKMNLLPKQAEKLCTELVREAKKFTSQSIIVCPSFESIETCTDVLKKSRSTIKLGAQDCAWDTSGAYTGAVSALALHQLGCKYCIIGHSERRRLFAETDEMIAQKISFLLNHTSITPILCVGETAGERRKGMQKKIVKQQIEKALGGVKALGGRNIILAYEPVWAIGTGVACTPKECSLMIDYCRTSLKKYTTISARIIYGGSVNAENVASFVEPNVSEGVLVGSASVDAKEFISLIKNSTTV